MTSFDAQLEQYADIAVKVGLNIQQDQELWINAPISAPQLVRKIVRKAYEAGAADVQVEWYDDECTQIKYRHAPLESFSSYPDWRVKAVEGIADRGGAYLLIESRNPALLEGVDGAKIATFAKAAGKALAKWREDMTSDKFVWSIIGAASPSWAQKVFPDMAEQEALQALWQAIFSASRVMGDDPAGNWEAHNAALLRKREYLNAKQYKKLHYRAPGTELTVALPDGHIWSGGSSVSQRGVTFNANIPTEEVFTSPLREGTNGVVSSSKPLSYQGNIIDRFSLKFENGRVVEQRAEQGGEVLGKMIGLDEGASYLGEVALVPHRSPISASNLTFFNTLYDENASNHLALGQAFAFCLQGGTAMTPEERRQAGLNNSSTHVDFMVGTADMDIDGETADGKLEPIFRQGNWAFD